MFLLNSPPTPFTSSSMIFSTSIIKAARTSESFAKEVQFHSTWLCGTQIVFSTWPLQKDKLMFDDGKQSPLPKEESLQEVQEMMIKMRNSIFYYYGSVEDWQFCLFFEGEGDYAAGFC